MADTCEEIARKAYGGYYESQQHNDNARAYLASRNPVGPG